MWTKLNVAEDTIAAYDYLQSLSGLEYFLEHTRIVSAVLFFRPLCRADKEVDV